MGEEYKGHKMYELAGRIFPICRSITGDGVRETLELLSDYVKQGTGLEFDIINVKSGTKVFDWMVPKEWKIRSAYITDENGRHIIDMNDNNLHVMGYSTPVDEWVGKDELMKYIYVLEEQPDVIPYVTSYYTERFGFCMSKNQRDSLKDGKYHMYINSDLFDGDLTYAELIIQGKEKDEIFFSTYDCHPSMANNECSGPVLMAELIKYVSSLQERRYTYRFIIVPETIGSITYLSTNNHLEYMKKTMVAGFNLSCVGDNNDYSIVRSRYANTIADKALMNVLKFHTDDTFSEYSFLDRGSDERQYNAPGVDLPVVCFCRSKFATFPEYHTSADNMDYISPDGFQGAFEVMKKVIDALEHNYKYRINVLCEPQLGRRGLQSTLSKKGTYDKIMPMRNFICMADGKKDLIDISNAINQPIDELIPIVKELKENELI